MEKFFNAFPTSSKQDWIDQAIKDLKEGDFHEKLVWKTAEGIEIMPFYTQEDLEQLQYLENYQNSAFDNNNAQLGARLWQNRQKIHVAKNEAEANKQALQALETGADAVCFCIAQSAEETDLDKLLNNILFPYCQVSFVLGSGQFAFFKKLENYLTGIRGYETEDLNGSLQLNGGNIEELADIVHASKSYTNFRSLVVTSEGEEVVEKVASLLEKSVAKINFLTESDISIPVIFKNLELSYQLGNSYFLEIASIRALRMLFTGIAREYGLTELQPNQLHIHANTKVQVNDKTQEKPEWNMISNTTQAMSAILGGCNSLSIQPHDSGIAPTSDFSLRIARNVSNLLREESYFDKVSDPAAGSYYIETLTHQIAQQAWEKFQGNI